VVGALIAAASGDVARTAVPLAFAAPEWIAPQFTPALLLGVGLPFSSSPWPRRTPPVRHAAGIRLHRTGIGTARRLWGLALLLAPVWGLLHLHRGDHRCDLPSPEAHPDPQQRWLAAWPQAVFICWPVCSAGRSRRCRLYRGVDPDAGRLALLGTIGGSCFRRYIRPVNAMRRC
jgi:benzoate membrane transport protein